NAHFSVEGRPDATGVVHRLGPSNAGGGRVELLLHLSDPHAPFADGSFVQVHAAGIAGEPMPVVPASAVVDTADGPLAYVVNGRDFPRAVVRVGARRVDLVEIIEWLYRGDAVVVHPLETLYMIELRATQGGGHGH